MATPTVTCPHCTMVFWNLRAEQLEAELSAQIAAKRIAQDECDRLEGELEKREKLLEYSWAERRRQGQAWSDLCQLRMTERDEARAVAGQLLRLARAQTKELALIESVQASMPQGTSARAAARGIDAVWRLPPGVRRLIQDA